MYKDIYIYIFHIGGVFLTKMLNVYFHSYTKEIKRFHGYDRNRLI